MTRRWTFSGAFAALAVIAACNNDKPASAKQQTAGTTRSVTQRPTTGTEAAGEVANDSAAPRDISNG